MTRKLPLFAALAASLFFLTISAEHVALARLVGGNTATTVTQPDQACFGGGNQGTSNTATEVCLDYNGHWVPTTTGVQKLGSSSLKWLDVEASNINQAGATASFGGPAGLLVQTTAQLVLAADTPTAVGSLVVARIVNGGTDNSTNGYALCVSTSVTTQSGGGTDIDWVYVSTKTTANIGTACK